MSYLSEKLYELRKEKKLSQEELAEKLNVARQTISKWENGTTVPDTNNLIEISKIFELSIDDLLGKNNKVEEEKKTEDVKSNNKKIIKRLLIITSIIFVVLYIVFIIYRCAIVYNVLDAVEKKDNYLDYIYTNINIGFSNGIQDEYKLIQGKKRNNELLIEHYKTNFSLEKTQFTADKEKVEYFIDDEYYNINMIDKTYTKEKNIRRDDIFYNVTTIKLDTQIIEFLDNQKINYRIPIWKFVFNLSNKINVRRYFSDSLHYEIYFKYPINGVRAIDLQKDLNGNINNLSISLDNGNLITEYESEGIAWTNCEIKDEDFEIPDLTNFTCVELKK